MVMIIIAHFYQVSGTAQSLLYIHELTELTLRAARSYVCGVGGILQTDSLPSCDLPSGVRRGIKSTIQKQDIRALGENTCYREK